jgi:hypothetical protein
MTRFGGRFFLPLRRPALRFEAALARSLGAKAAILGLI